MYTLLIDQPEKLFPDTFPVTLTDEQGTIIPIMFEDGDYEATSVSWCYDDDRGFLFAWEKVSTADDVADLTAELLDIDREDIDIDQHSVMKF